MKQTWSGVKYLCIFVLFLASQVSMAQVRCEDFFSRQHGIKPKPTDTLLELTLKALNPEGLNRTDRAANEQALLTWLKQNPQHPDSIWLSEFIHDFSQNPKKALMLEKYELNPLTRELMTKLSPLVFAKGKPFSLQVLLLDREFSNFQFHLSVNRPDHFLTLDNNLNSLKEMIENPDLNGLDPKEETISQYKRALHLAVKIRGENPELAEMILTADRFNSPYFLIDINKSDFSWLKRWLHDFLERPENLDENEKEQAEIISQFLNELKKPMPENADFLELSQLYLIKNEELFTNHLIENLLTRMWQGEADVVIEKLNRDGLRPFVFSYRVASLAQDIIKNGSSVKVASELEVLNEKIKMGFSYFPQYFFGSGSIATQSAQNRILKKNLLAGAEKPDQTKAVELLFMPKSLKETLFTKINMTKYLQNPQNWFSWNSPQRATQLLAFWSKQNDQVKNQINTLLKQKVGRSVKELKENAQILSIHTDEIIDAFASFYRERANNNLAADYYLKELETLLPKEEFVFRYFSRVPTDANLGKRCGDCTAPGGINSGNSLTWFYNPLYQVVRLEKDNRFIGRFNLALVQINNKPALLVDAMEFHPQTKDHAKYQELLLQGIRKAVERFKDLAAREGRALYFLLSSNTSSANSQVAELGRQLSKQKLTLKIGLPVVDLAHILNGNKSDLITLEPYYQTLERAQEPLGQQMQESPLDNPGYSVSVAPYKRAESNPQEEQRKKDLESFVFIPASKELAGFREYVTAAYHETSILKQEELLLKAANALLQSKKITERLKQVFSIKEHENMSEYFVAQVLKERFGSQLPTDQFRAFFIDGSHLVAF